MDKQEHQVEVQSADKGETPKSDDNHNDDEEEEEEYTDGDAASQAAELTDYGTLHNVRGRDDNNDDNNDEEPADKPAVLYEDHIDNDNNDVEQPSGSDDNDNDAALTTPKTHTCRNGTPALTTAEPPLRQPTQGTKTRRQKNQS